MENKKTIYNFFKNLNIKNEYEELKKIFNSFLEKNSDIIQKDNQNKCVEVGKYIRDKEKSIIREKVQKQQLNIKDIMNAKNT